MGYVMVGHGPISIELRRESFIIHHDDPRIESVEYDINDIPHLTDALQAAYDHESDESRGA